MLAKLPRVSVCFLMRLSCQLHHVSRCLSEPLQFSTEDVPWRVEPYNSATNYLAHVCVFEPALPGLIGWASYLLPTCAIGCSYMTAELKLFEYAFCVSDTSRLRSLRRRHPPAPLFRNNQRNLRMLAVAAYPIPRTVPFTGRGLDGRYFAQLTRLPTQVRNALTAANRADLNHLWPSDMARALLNSISSRPGSMWLDAVPYAPSLRLEDQSFQDAGRVRMGVRTFSSFGACWTCSCGHTVEDDDVAHALGCNRLSGLVQSRHYETAEFLREFVGRLGFSSSREGRYSRLAPRIPNRPPARWDFHCNLRPGPGHVLANVSFIHPVAAS
jgi:hypothetical protein